MKKLLVALMAVLIAVMGLPGLTLANSPPEPEIINPIEGALVYGDCRIQVVELAGTEVVSCLAEYSPDGINWTAIDTDYDGTDGSEGGKDFIVTSTGDGWKVTWDTSTVAEGNYHIRATMTDSEGLTGEDQIMVYVEPTPPLPNIVEPRDEESVIGTITLRATTADEDVEYCLWEYKQVPLCFEKGIPLKCQYNYGGSDNRCWCVPTAAAACLAYWDANGFPNLYDETDPKGQEKMVDELARKMGTGKYGPLGACNGTSWSGLERGLKKYLNQKGHGCDNATGLSVNRTDNPTFLDFKKELAQCEDVLWGITWVSDNKTYGHRMVGNSVCNIKKKDGYPVDFMDPACGRIVEGPMSDNGSFRDPDVGWTNPNPMFSVSPKVQTGWTEIAKVTEPNAAGEWVAEWDTSEVPHGVYLIKVVMRDKGGHELHKKVIIIVDCRPPVNNPSYPQYECGEQNPDGSYPVTIHDQLNDPMGRIKKVVAKVDDNVEFEADDIGLSEYQFSFTVNLLPGEHTIAIGAWDYVEHEMYKISKRIIPPPEVGGEVYPVDKLAILAPWIAFGVATIAGAIMAVRRRRTQN